MFSNPVHRQFMNMLNSYYDEPSLQKVKEQEGTSVYMCRISSLLLKEHRYLVAMASSDTYPIGHVMKLSDITWKYFQARTLEGDEYSGILQHTYVTKREMDWPVIKVKSTKEYSVFVDDKGCFPIEITLLHTSEDEYEYPSRGSFASCLETFQTMMRFVDV